MFTNKPGTKALESRLVIPFLSVCILSLLFGTVVQDISSLAQSTGNIITEKVTEIYQTVQQRIINVTKTIAQAAGIEKVETLYPNQTEITLPVTIDKPVRIITISPASPIASVLNCLSKTIAMTINPIGIITIGEMPAEVQQEELYHWWDASRLGTVRYYYEYVTEYIERCIKYQDTHVAYRYLSFELRAKAYAGWVMTLV